MRLPRYYSSTAQCIYYSNTKIEPNQEKTHVPALMHLSWHMGKQTLGGQRLYSGPGVVGTTEITKKTCLLQPFADEAPIVAVSPAPHICGRKCPAVDMRSFSAFQWLGKRLFAPRRAGPISGHNFLPSCSVGLAPKTIQKNHSLKKTLL